MDTGGIHLVDSRPDERPGVDFMLRVTADTDPNVALEACKFLPTFSSLNKGVVYQFY